MPNRNFLFFMILLAALVVVLVATGAAPILWQLGTNIVNGIAALVRGLIHR